MLSGCDISEDQGDLPVEWFKQWQFVIIRVWNEFGTTDKYFTQNWDRCKVAGTPRGAYAWPITGRDNTQLGQFLRAVTPDSEAGWWADYESVHNHLVSVSDLENFVRGCNGGFYSNLSELPRSTYLDNRPWWFANPSNNPAPRSHLIEQYGVHNNVDVDTAYESLLMGTDMTADEHAWLQFVYIQLGGAKWEAAGKPFPIPNYLPSGSGGPLTVELSGKATPSA